MAYREIGGGGFHAWTEEGDILEGIWRGTSYGAKYDNRIGKIEIAAEKEGENPKETAFSYTAVLAQKLDSVPVGSKIKIKYVGKDKTKDGTSFKQFRVLADTDGVTGPTDLELRGREASRPVKGPDGPTKDGFGDNAPPSQDEFNKSAGDDDPPF